MIEPPVEEWVSLTALNGLIGATRRDHTWTDFLYQTGWSVSQLEPDLFISQPKGSPERVRADLVLYHSATERLLLVEIKIGAVEADQLRRYLALSLDDVKSKSLVTNVTGHQVVYCTTSIHQSSVEIGLTGSGLPLIVFSNDQVTLAGGELAHPELEALLREGHPIQGHVPQHYVPFDLETSDADVCGVVIPVVMGFIINGQSVFETSDVLRSILSEMYESMSISYRGDLSQRAERVLRLLTRTAAFGGLLTRVPQRWRIDASLIGTATTPGAPLAPLRQKLQEFLIQLGGQATLDI